MLKKLCDPRDFKRHTSFKRSWISGERDAPIVIEETGVIHLVGVRFKPGGAYPFFRFPISEFTARVVELDSVWGGEIDRLRQQLADAAQPAAVFAHLEGWLSRRLTGQAEPCRPVAFALDRIRIGGEDARIGRIVEQTGISHKHLVREFDRHVGLSPKTFARVCAFQSAVKHIGFKPSVDWADTAAACGYFDQAHFIREFRSFTGMTPAVYLNRRGPFLNYVTVD